MLFTGIMLAMKLAAAPYMRITPEQAAPLATVARDVALEVAPLIAGKSEYASRLLTMNVAIVFTAAESAANTRAIGDCENPLKRTLDTCNSIGAMQINKRWLRHPVLESFAMTPAMFIEASLEKQIEMSLAVMRFLVSTCGTLRRGLYAYAGGTCIPTPRAKIKIDYRCEIVGGC